MEATDARRRRSHLVLLLAGAGLVGALLALPWHTYAISVAGAGSFKFERTGVQSPEEGLGQIALVVAAVLVVFVGLVLTRGRSQPEFGPGFDPVLMVLSLAVAALLAIKLVLNTDFLGTGAWTSMALGAVIVWAGLTLRGRGRLQTER